MNKIKKENQFFLIINEDGSLVTLTEKDVIALQDGQTKKIILEKPKEHINKYKWDFDKEKIIKRTATEIKKIDAEEKAITGNFLLDTYVTLKNKLDMAEVLQEEKPNINWSHYIKGLKDEIKKIEVNLK